MTKILSLLFLLSLISLPVNAQMEVTLIDGTPITDGQLFEYGVTTTPESSLGFKVNNTSTEDIYIQIECTELVNTTGVGFEVCVGLVCASGVSVGTSIPTTPYMIAAGGSNGNDDHFYIASATSSNNNYPLDFSFKIKHVNSNGIQVGNAINLTYRYDPNLGVDDLSTDTTLEDMGVSILNTQVIDKIGISLEKDVSYSIYSSAGTLVQQGSMKKEEEVIDFQSTNSGVYMIQFENAEGQTAGTRIIKN